MALTYGKQEILRFMYDMESRKLILAIKQEILEEGVVVSHIFPQVIARGEDFDIILEQLLPSDATKIKDVDIKKHIEIEGKAIIESQKQTKIKKEKEAKK